MASTGCFQILVLERPAAMVLVKPADTSHDMAAQPELWTFGSEHSSSHNHRHHLSQAGFRSIFEKETRNHGRRLVMMVGVRD